MIKQNSSQIDNSIVAVHFYCDKLFLNVIFLLWEHLLDFFFFGFFIIYSLLPPLGCTIALIPPFLALTLRMNQ